VIGLAISFMTKYLNVEKISMIMDNMNKFMNNVIDKNMSESEQKECKDNIENTENIEGIDIIQNLIYK
jgi:hypothetical protein